MNKAKRLRFLALSIGLLCGGIASGGELTAAINILKGGEQLAIADQGVTVEADEGQTQVIVHLDGSESTASVGNTIQQYTWFLNDNEGNKSWQRGATLDVTLDIGKTYTIMLRVKDQNRVKSSTSIDVEVAEYTGQNNSINVPPVADAGADQTVNSGEPFELDGRSSLDSDGEIVWYKWQIADVTEEGADMSALHYTLTESTTVTLWVQDNDGEWNSDNVLITIIREGNSSLEANAGGNQTVRYGQRVELNGTQSGGNIAYYKWLIGDDITIEGEHQSILRHRFTKTTDVQLIVTDIAGNTATDTITVTVNNQKGAFPNTKNYNVLFIGVDDLRPEIEPYNYSTGFEVVAKTPKLASFAKTAMTFNRAYCQQAVCSASRGSLLTGVRPQTTGITTIKNEFRKTYPNAYTLGRLFRDNGYKSRSIGKIFHKPQEDDTIDESNPDGGTSESWSKIAFKSSKGLCRVSDRKKVEVEKPQKGGGTKTILVNQWPSTEKGEKEVNGEMVSLADNDYQDGCNADEAKRLLNEFENDDSSAPFFLAVGFQKPHLPLSAPAKYWDMYDDNTLLYDSLQPDHAPEGTEEFTLLGVREPTSYYDLRQYFNFEKDDGWHIPHNSEKAKTLIHGYYACVSYIDEMIGQVIEALDNSPFADNTIVVIWSDHGWKLNDYGSWSKQTVYETDCRVPLFIRVPGYTDGETTDALVELVDLYPTLQELCGADRSMITANRDPSIETDQMDPLEGLSMVKLIEDPSIESHWKKAAFSEYTKSTYIDGVEKELLGCSIRSGDYRYTEWIGKRDIGVYHRELYKHTGAHERIAQKNLIPNGDINQLTDPTLITKVDQLSALLDEGNGWKTVRQEVATEFGIDLN